MIINFFKKLIFLKLIIIIIMSNITLEPATFHCSTVEGILHSDASFEMQGHAFLKEQPIKICYWDGKVNYIMIEENGKQIFFEEPIPFTFTDELLEELKKLSLQNNDH